MQVWTQLKFLPSLEGVSKGPGRRETLCLRGEKKFLIGYQAPEDSPDLGAVKFLCLDIDRSFHRVPYLPGDSGAGPECWRMGVYVGYRKGNEPKNLD